MLLERPLWILEPDKRWVSLERNGAFVLQQYKYGGVGKGVQLSNGLLHLAKIRQQSEGPLLSPAARIFHGSYRIITAFPIAMDGGTGLGPEQGSADSEKEEGGRTSRAMKKNRIWLLSESNNRATASRDMIALLILLASESTPAFLAVLEAENAGEFERIPRGTGIEGVEQEGEGQADLPCHSNSESNGHRPSQSNVPAVIGKASDQLMGVLKRLSLSLDMRRSSEAASAGGSSAEEMNSELWTDDVMGSLIFSSLPLRSLVMCQGVCRSWKRLASQDSIWAEHLERLNSECDLLSSSDLANVPSIPSFPFSSPSQS